MYKTSGTSPSATASSTSQNASPASRACKLHLPPCTISAANPKSVSPPFPLWLHRSERLWIDKSEGVLGSPHCLVDRADALSHADVVVVVVSETYMKCPEAALELMLVRARCVGGIGCASSSPTPSPIPARLYVSVRNSRHGLNMHNNTRCVCAGWSVQASSPRAESEMSSLDSCTSLRRSCWSSARSSRSPLLARMPCLSACR